MTQTIIERLASVLNATEDRQGRWHADCPSCGAPGTRNGRPLFHFYFSANERFGGASCWVCGYRQSLHGLLRDLGDEGDYRPPVRGDVAPQAPPPWQVAGAWQKWQRAMEPRQEAIWQTWQSYRPFTRETVARAGLAVERLVFHDPQRGWYHGRHARLLVPIVRQRQMVGIRGRAYQPLDDGPKWISATGTETWLCGLENVRKGSRVIWCESLADRLLGDQEHPEYVHIASGGLTWSSEWLDYLASARPHSVTIWFDNDLSGNGNAYREVEWVDAWKAEMTRRRSINPQLRNQPMPKVPEPKGPKLALELRKRGVRVELYDWPHDSPEHADMGLVLMEQMRHVQAE